MGDAGAVTDDRRMALGGRGDVLVAVVDHPHRSPGLPGQQRCVQRDHRWVLFLAAEPAAGLGLDDPGLSIVDGETALERGVDVIRALQRSGHGHPAVVLRHGDHRVVLDVQLLLVTHPVLAFEHEVRGSKGRVRVTGGELVGCEGVIRHHGIEDRRQLLGSWTRGVPRGAKRRPIGRREQRQGFGVVLDLPTDRDEDRLVGLDRADDVVAGDVGSGHDNDLGPVERRVEVEREEPGVRVGRTDRGAIPGAREHEVVGVLGLAGQLGRSLAPERSGSSRATRGDGAGLDDDGVGGAVRVVSSGTDPPPWRVTLSPAD